MVDLIGKNNIASGSEKSISEAVALPPHLERVNHQEMAMALWEHHSNCQVTRKYLRFAKGMRFYGVKGGESHGCWTHFMGNELIEKARRDFPI